MKRFPLTQEHGAKLQEYGLQDISQDACSYLRFEPGETLTQEGMPLSHLAIIVSGQAKIYRTAHNGKTLILCYYVSQGMIGEVELIQNQEVAVATVKALTDLECIAIRYGDCLAALRTNMSFQRKLGAVLAEKLVAVSENFTSSMLCSAEQRLCSYIVKNAYREVFRDVLTDVSASVGISYRHMLRLLAQFCEEGILARQASGYLIVDQQELLRRCCIVDAEG